MPPCRIGFVDSNDTLLLPCVVNDHDEVERSCPLDQEHDLLHGVGLEADLACDPTEPTFSPSTGECLHDLFDDIGRHADRHEAARDQPGVESARCTRSMMLPTRALSHDRLPSRNEVATPLFEPAPSPTTTPSPAANTDGTEHARPASLRLGSKENDLAEGVGFEPTEGCPSHAFQACRFGRSRIPPGAGDATGGH